MATIKGGHIESSTNSNNYAEVNIVVVNQKNGSIGNWIVTLKDVPKISNFTLGEKIVYNSKGTRNTNADNILKVSHVIGPSKYTCSGNWPINF